MHHRPCDTVAPGEANFSDGGMGNQGLTRCGVAGHDVKSAFGNAGFQCEFPKTDCNERGLGRRLEHHSVASGEREDHRHADGDQWTVPRNDDADDANWFMLCIGQSTRANRFADRSFNLISPTRIISDPRQGEGCAARRHRGSDFKRRHADQFVTMTFDKVGKTKQCVPSTRAAHVIPCPLPGNRGTGRGINFGWSTDGHHGLHLAGRRIDVVACA